MFQARGSLVPSPCTNRPHAICRCFFPAALYNLDSQIEVVECHVVPCRQPRTITSYFWRPSTILPPTICPPLPFAPVPSDYVHFASCIAIVDCCVLPGGFVQLDSVLDGLVQFVLVQFFVEQLVPSPGDCVQFSQVNCNG